MWWAFYSLKPNPAASASDKIDNKQMWWRIYNNKSNGIFSTNFFGFFPSKIHSFGSSEKKSIYLMLSNVPNPIIITFFIHRTIWICKIFEQTASLIQYFHHNFSYTKLKWAESNFSTDGTKNQWFHITLSQIQKCIFFWIKLEFIEHSIATTKYNQHQKCNGTSSPRQIKCRAVIQHRSVLMSFFLVFSLSLFFAYHFRMPWHRLPNFPLDISMSKGVCIWNWCFCVGFKCWCCWHPHQQITQQQFYGQYLCFDELLRRWFK